MASKFFLKNEFALKDDYKIAVGEKFKADAENFDFEDSVGAAKVSSRYCSKFVQHQQLAFVLDGQRVLQRKDAWKNFETCRTGYVQGSGCGVVERRLL